MGSGCYDLIVVVIVCRKACQKISKNSQRNTYALESLSKNVTTLLKRDYDTSDLETAVRGCSTK